MSTATICSCAAIRESIAAAPTSPSSLPSIADPPAPCAPCPLPPAAPGASRPSPAARAGAPGLGVGRPHAARVCDRCSRVRGLRRATAFPRHDRRPAGRHQDPRSPRAAYRRTRPDGCASATAARRVRLRHDILTPTADRRLTPAFPRDVLAALSLDAAASACDAAPAARAARPASAALFACGERQCKANVRLRALCPPVRAKRPIVMAINFMG